MYSACHVTIGIIIHIVCQASNNIFVCQSIQVSVKVIIGSFPVSIIALPMLYGLASILCRRHSRRSRKQRVTATSYILINTFNNIHASGNKSMDTPTVYITSDCTVCCRGFTVCCANISPMTV